MRPISLRLVAKSVSMISWLPAIFDDAFRRLIAMVTFGSFFRYDKNWIIKRFLFQNVPNIIANWFLARLKTKFQGLAWFWAILKKESKFLKFQVAIMTSFPVEKYSVQCYQIKFASNTKNVRENAKICSSMRFRGSGNGHWC